MPPTPLTRRSRPSGFDLVLAGGITLLLLIVTPHIPADQGTGQHAVDAGALVLVAIAGSSLAFRRVTPRLTLAVATTAVAVYALANYVGGPVYLTPLVALFTIASLDGRRAATLPAVLVTAVLIAGGLTPDRSYQAVLLHLLFASWAVAAVLVGDVIRSRVLQVEALREQARVLEETREEEARRRVAEERVRIARDLHDVVAHSLASISIQAGMGAHVIDRRPDEARAALIAIKAASKEALDELRATLDVLRERDASAPTAPTAGLAALSTLTAGPEQAGLAVTVEIEGLDHRRVPATLDMTAYRIVQESLTNVMRHAEASAVTVRVRAQDGTLEVDVIDDGVGVAALPPGAVPSGGHGLVGMQERAALVGGRVTAGPAPGGRGFRVHAVLPLPRTPTGDALHDETDVPVT